jgi:hypothetical protein
VNGTANLNSRSVARCAGAVDGYLTHHRIYQYFTLIFDMQGWNLSLPYPQKTRDYLNTNLQYVQDAVADYLDVPYWSEIRVILWQFDGLVEG